MDLAKSVFEAAVSKRPGGIAERHCLSRGQFSRLLAERGPATLVMEAFGTAHFWGREAQARGHEVVLLPPHAVRPYVLRNKTDGPNLPALRIPLPALPPRAPRSRRESVSHQPLHAG